MGVGANALCASLFNSSDLQKHQNVMFNSRFVIPVDILVIDKLIYVTSNVRNRKYVPMSLVELRDAMPKWLKFTDEMNGQLAIGENKLFSFDAISSGIFMPTTPYLM